jgi:PhzF family phenazine biosynthesis protein
MQAIAAEVGYSETVFAAPMEGGWRVRYFAPEVEVEFCGHATIALGAALALQHGDGIFVLRLNNACITVEGRQTETTLTAALQSPPTRSAPADEAQRRPGARIARRCRHLQSNLPGGATALPCA